MLKKILFQHCADHLNESLILVEKRKADLFEALESESKSSAGDKHETGRAMLQLEREKLGKQLKEIEKKQKLLWSLKNQKTTTSVSIGSVVKTDHLNYYLAISCPTLSIDKEKYYCISALSPIGKLLLGKKVKDTIQFNNTTSTIKVIF